LNRQVLIVAGILSVCSLTSKGQQADSLLNNTSLSELDAMLSLEDSLSIFTMIDSLIKLTEAESKSSLAVRLGYNSNAASNNRTLGINQFGLSPGLSYYHKSGAYLDASGYWSTEYDPSYYLSILSAGYIGIISKRWSFLGEYSRYLYSDLGDDVVISYKNSVGVSNFFDVKPFTFRLDYTLLFGEKAAHRLLPGVMLNLEKRNLGKINRILFYPSFNLLMGSEKVGTNKFAPYSDLLRRVILNRNRPASDQLPLTYELEENIFGIMNYSFTAPVSISIKNWNFLLSYTYNIPKSLPNEDLQLSNSGYLSASVTRYIRFK